MAYSTDAYITDRPAAAAMPAERATFIRKTYGHLAGAVAVFIGLETLLIQSGVGETILRSIVGAGTIGMVALMAAFIGAGYLAQGHTSGGEQDDGTLRFQEQVRRRIRRLEDTTCGDDGPEESRRRGRGF